MKTEHGHTILPGFRVEQHEHEWQLCCETCGTRFVVRDKRPAQARAELTPQTLDAAFAEVVEQNDGPNPPELAR